MGDNALLSSSFGNIGITILGEYPCIADGVITPKLNGFKWIFYLLSASLVLLVLFYFNLLFLFNEDCI